MNKQSKNSSEIVADILKNKLEKLKEKQQQIKNKLKDANELIRHKKETENQRITINEISAVSEIIKLANGQTIGFSLSNNAGVSYYDKNKRLVAKETKSGTYTPKGKLVSYQSIGMIVLGMSVKIAVKQGS